MNVDTLPVVSVSSAVAEAIQAIVRKRECLDEDDLRHSSLDENNGLSYQDFRLFFRKFEDIVPDFETDDRFDYSDFFGDIRIPFIVENTGFRFVWRVLLGQGSAYQIWNDSSQEIPFDEKNAIRVNVGI